MILTLTILVLLLAGLSITNILMIRSTRAGANDMAIELHKQIQAAHESALHCHERLNQFPRVEISCEAVVCALDDRTYTVMFANVHYPALANKKQAYTVTLPRFPHEPVSIGQIRVFSLTAAYNYPPGHQIDARNSA